MNNKRYYLLYFTNHICKINIKIIINMNQFYINYKYFKWNYQVSFFKFFSKNIRLKDESRKY